MPGSLELISFGEEFNQSISNVLWPDSLKTITFGIKFNQPLDFLPEGLETLIIYSLNYKHYLGNLPFSIKKMIFSDLNIYDMMPNEFKNKYNLSTKRNYYYLNKI